VTRRTLAFDPIAQATINWRGAGWDDAAPGMALVTSVMRAQQLFQARVDTVLTPFELTFARFEVLMLLDFTKRGQLPLARIGERLQVHPASVTNAINRLEAAQLVTRQPHPTDGRTTLAVITPAGRRRVRQAAMALNDEVFTQLEVPAAAADQVVAVLAGLRRSAGDFADAE